MKTLKSLFKPSSNLIYDYPAFQVKAATLILEADLEIILPKQLIGKNIKQVKLIPKFKDFEVVFTYEPDKKVLSKVKPNDKILSLGLKNLVTSTKNSMIWIFLINKTFGRSPRFILDTYL
ncbi:MAG: hypothetical protein ABFS56_06800 [Pseudomonadota bacterium]